MKIKNKKNNIATRVSLKMCLIPLDCMQKELSIYITVFLLIKVFSECGIYGLEKAKTIAAIARILLSKMRYCLIVEIDFFHSS